jgi:hypothetical protein
VDPIELETEAYEQTNILELIQTGLVCVWRLLVYSYQNQYHYCQIINNIALDNRLFNKVMKVFAWICDESLLLENIVRFVGEKPRLLISLLKAEEKFYVPLLLFGEELRDGDVQEGEIQLQIGESESVHKGRNVTLLSPGRILPLIVELAQFVDRINTVFLNGIRQFASLYHEKQTMYNASFARIHLRPAVEALGRLLMILVTLDEIAGRNEALQNAWAK